jgi:hypothetical protein
MKNKDKPVCPIPKDAKAGDIIQKQHLANILRDIEFMCEGGTKEELNIAAYIQYARDGKSPNDIRAAISASAQPPQSENELHAIIRQLDTRCMEAELELSHAHQVLADLRIKESSIAASGQTQGGGELSIVTHGMTRIFSGPGHAVMSEAQIEFKRLEAEIADLRAQLAEKRTALSGLESLHEITMSVATASNTKKEIEIADLRAQLAAAQAQVHDAGMQLSTSEENLYWCQQREDAALMDVDDLHAQLAAAQAERDQLKAGLQECRDALVVAKEAQSGARDGYRDAIKNITAERDDLRRRLVKAVELLGEVKTRLYGHVPLANAQHIDLFRRICVLVDATEQQRDDAGEAAK